MAVNREKIESLWRRSELAALTRSLAERRTEWSEHSIEHVPQSPGAAALGILTLLEIGTESSDPLIREMAGTLAKEQAVEGSWGRPGVTALAMRALSACGHQQASFARGLAFLAMSQLGGGSWAGEGAEEFHDTAFVLSMLGDLEDFQSAVDVERAVEWYNESRFEVHGDRQELVDCSEKQWAVALQRVQRDGALAN